MGEAAEQSPLEHARVLAVEHGRAACIAAARSLIKRSMRRAYMLLALMTLYGAASLLHFVHNAVYIQDYPNLPKWITSLGVFASWCVIAVIGALGYWLYLKVSRAYGLMAIAIYALLGFGGLDHYVLAPIGAHSVAMNATIIAEVSAASMLLIFIAYLLPTSRKRIGLS
jgi:hypothetical protein